MAIFKGFKQVRLETYQAAVENGTAQDYLWLVQTYSGETPVDAAIYFGSRKYGEVNAASEEKIQQIIESLGGLVDENGEWEGFLPTHEILGNSGITSVEEALEALEEAVLEAKALAEQKVDTTTYEDKVAELEAGIALNSDAIDDLESELALKANAADVYTKNEVDGKISGVFHFNGVAEAISADGTTLTGGDAGEGLVASAANMGDVYQVGDKEYASNASVWVELGFNVDLSSITNRVAAVESGLSQETAERQELAAAVSEIDNALAEEISRVNDINDRVETLEDNATTTVNTYADASALTLELGQIVYVTNSEDGESGHTAGAYIYTQNGLQKLEASTGTGETPMDRIEALELKMGNTALPNGETVTSIITQLINIDGDDVE